MNGSWLAGKDSNLQLPAPEAGVPPLDYPPVGTKNQKDYSIYTPKGQGTGKRLINVIAE